MQYLNNILNLVILAFLIVSYYNLNNDDRTLINILILYTGFLLFILWMDPKMAFILSFLELSCIYMIMILISEFMKF